MDETHRKLMIFVSFTFLMMKTYNDLCMCYKLIPFLLKIIFTTNMPMMLFTLTLIDGILKLISSLIIPINLLKYFIKEKGIKQNFIQSMFIAQFHKGQ